MHHFTLKIKGLRNFFSLNQRDFADKIGVSQATICAWEKGRNAPQIYNLQKLCDECDVELAYFL